MTHRIYIKCIEDVHDFFLNDPYSKGWLDIEKQSDKSYHIVNSHITNDNAEECPYEKRILSFVSWTAPFMMRHPNDNLDNVEVFNMANHIIADIPCLGKVEILIEVGDTGKIGSITLKEELEYMKGQNWNVKQIQKIFDMTVLSEWCQGDI